MEVFLIIFLIWFFWGAIQDGIEGLFAMLVVGFLIYVIGKFFLNVYIGMPRTFFIVGILLWILIAKLLENDGIYSVREAFYFHIPIFWPVIYSFLYVLCSNLAYIYNNSWVESNGLKENIEILSYFKFKSYFEIYKKWFTEFPNTYYFSIDLTVFLFLIMFLIYPINKSLKRKAKLKADKAIDDYDAEQKRLAVVEAERKRREAIQNEKNKNYNVTGIYETDSERSYREKREWKPPPTIKCFNCNDSNMQYLKSVKAFNGERDYLYKCQICYDQRELLNSDFNR